MKFGFYFMLLWLPINILAGGLESIYVQTVKQDVIRLSGPSFRKLWKSRGASDEEIERRLAATADDTAHCHEEQFILFGQKYYAVVIKHLESGKYFDKAFDTAVSPITKDIDSGLLPKSSTEQQLKSFYLNVGLCKSKRFVDE